MRLRAPVLDDVYSHPLVAGDKDGRVQVFVKRYAELARHPRKGAGCHRDGWTYRIMGRLWSQRISLPGKPVVENEDTGACEGLAPQLEIHRDR